MYPQWKITENKYVGPLYPPYLRERAAQKQLNKESAGLPFKGGTMENFWY